jgi:hypothetical protein
VKPAKHQKPTSPKPIWKRLISVCLIIALTAMVNWAVFLAKPQKAEADWSGAVDTALSAMEQVFDNITWPAIRNVIKTALITAIQEQIIGYINGEDGGRAQFITNFRRYLYEDTEYFVVGLLEDYFDAEIGVNIDGALESLLIEVAKDKPRKPRSTLKNYVKNVFNWNAERDGYDAVIASWDLNNNTWGIYLDATDTIVGTSTSEKEKQETEQVVTAISNNACQPKTDENGNVITPCWYSINEVSSAIDAIYDELANSDNPFVAFMAPIIAAGYNRALREGIKEYNEFEREANTYLDNKIDDIFEEVEP